LAAAERRQQRQVRDVVGAAEALESVHRGLERVRITLEPVEHREGDQAEAGPVGGGPVTQREQVRLRALPLDRLLGAPDVAVDEEPLELPSEVDGEKLLAEVAVRRGELRQRLGMDARETAGREPVGDGLHAGAVAHEEHHQDEIGPEELALLAVERDPFVGQAPRDAAVQHLVGGDLRQRT
jgi:hypothetical protein